MLPSVSSLVGVSATPCERVHTQIECQRSEPVTQAAVVLEQLWGYIQVYMCGKLVKSISNLALNSSTVGEMRHGKCRWYFDLQTQSHSVQKSIVTWTCVLP